MDNSNEPSTSGPDANGPGTSEPETNETNTSGPETHVPLTSVAKVSVERLRLDGRNPRLFAIGDEPSDIDIIAELYRSEDLSELLQSMAANGYLDIEPLIVLEEHGYLTVLEGNRRLAAIRLLETPALVTQILKRTRVRITVPTLPEALRDTIREVSVYRVNSREDARSFIGFKHINGAAKWGSYAKARFAANWHRSGEATLEEIAAQIGDNHDTIKRMVNGIYVLEQADKADVFHLSDRAVSRFNFSHLYTALSRTPYMRFLGLEEAWTGFEPKQNPIPKENLELLKEVLRWLFGSKESDVRPVIRSQNPDVRRLGEVLDNPEALTILRGSRSLDEAHLSTVPANQRFSESLIRARTVVRDASNNLRGFDGQERSMVGIAEDVLETSRIIRNRMVEKVEEVGKAQNIEDNPQ